MPSDMETGVFASIQTAHDMTSLADGAGCSAIMPAKSLAEALDGCRKITSAAGGMPRNGVVGCALLLPGDGTMHVIASGNGDLSYCAPVRNVSFSRGEGLLGIADLSTAIKALQSMQGDASIEWPCVNGIATDKSVMSIECGGRKALIPVGKVSSLRAMCTPKQLGDPVRMVLDKDAASWMKDAVAAAGMVIVDSPSNIAFERVAVASGELGTFVVADAPAAGVQVSFLNKGITAKGSEQPTMLLAQKPFAEGMRACASSSVILDTGRPASASQQSSPAIRVFSDSEPTLFEMSLSQPSQPFPIGMAKMLADKLDATSIACTVETSDFQGKSSVLSFLSAGGPQTVVSISFAMPNADGTMNISMVATDHASGKQTGSADIVASAASCQSGYRGGDTVKVMHSQLAKVVSALKPGATMRLVRPLGTHNLGIIAEPLFGGEGRAVLLPLS